MTEMLSRLRRAFNRCAAERHTKIRPLSSVFYHLIQPPQTSALLT